MKKCSRCKKIKDESDFDSAKRRNHTYFRKQCRECRSEMRRIYLHEMRIETIKHYSNGKMECACCGEKELKFLTMDHIHGCGVKKRKEHGHGTHLHFWIRKQGYPKIFQILCFNCNCAKGAYGKCPHKR